MVAGCGPGKHHWSQYTSNREWHRQTNTDNPRSLHQHHPNHPRILPRDDSRLLRSLRVLRPPRNRTIRNASSLARTWYLQPARSNRRVSGVLDRALGIVQVCAAGVPALLTICRGAEGGRRSRRSGLGGVTVGSAENWSTKHPARFVLSRYLNSGIGIEPHLTWPGLRSPRSRGYLLSSEQKSSPTVASWQLVADAFVLQRSTPRWV